MKVASRSRSAFLGIISSQAYVIIGMLVSIFSMPLMVRYLDKEAYGLSILFFQLIGYLALFDFGFGAAVVRQLALHRDEDEHNQLMVNKIMSTGTFAFGTLGLILTIIGFFFAPFVPSIYHLRPDLAAAAVPIVFTLSLAMGAQFLYRALGGIFYAHHRQALLSTTYFLISTSSTLLTIYLLYRGVGLWAFAYANVFQVVGLLLVQVVLLRRYYPNLKINWGNFDKDLLRSLFGYGKFMFLHGLATQVILNTDRLVIGKVAGLTAVALFSITVRIPEVGLTLLGRVADNLTPAVMEIVAHESTERIREQYRRVLLLTAGMGALAFWLILAFNQWFITLWVGPSFFAGSAVLVLALVIMVQQVLVRSMSFFLYARGNNQQLSLMSMFEAVINILLSVFLGHRIGLPGVLAGTLIASSVTSSWYTPYLLRRYLDIPLRDSLRAIVVPMLGVSAVGGVLYLLVRWAQQALPPTIWLFGLLGVVAGSVLTAFTWLLFLRPMLGSYVPARFRRYLLVPAEVAA